MRKFHIFFTPFFSSRMLCAAIIICFSAHGYAQTRNLDGKEYKRYSSSYFKPHRGLFYNIYFSPVYTVDPLGFGGKSTYGLGLGTRINLWESKTPASKYSGMKVTGLYLAFAYEYYPQQYNKTYGSLWVRIKALIPLAARMDILYCTGYGLQGVNYRYCFGFEVKSVTVFICGEVTGYFPIKFGQSPKEVSPYANAGAIMLNIPLYTRK